MTPAELTAWRTAAKMTQDQLAAALNISRPTVARYEGGTSPMPAELPEQLAKLATLLLNPPPVAAPTPPSAPLRYNAPRRYRTGFYQLNGQPMTYAAHAALKTSEFYLYHFPADGWQVICRRSAWRGKCDGADMHWRDLAPWDVPQPDPSMSYDPMTLHPDRCFFPMHETVWFAKRPGKPDEIVPAPTFVLCRKGLCYVRPKW